MHSNFRFLAEHSPLLAQLGATAEKLYPFDPASCVLKLRLLAEALTQEIASRIGLRLVQATQAELLRAVDQRMGLDTQVDIAWLKDDSVEDAADLPEPAVLAREAVQELNAAVTELEAILAELGEALEAQ